MEIIEVIFRTGGAFIFLLMLTRLLGKKQVSQLTYFNYVAGITFGSITASLFISPDTPVVYGFTSLVVWALFTMLADILSIKSPRARVLMEGEPTIIIKDGKILENSLRSLRLSIDDVNMLLRNQKIFSVKDVDYAIFEQNGKISVLKKVDQQNITKKDMNIASNRVFFPTELISDGKILYRNLRELNLNPEWLNNQLNNAGINNVEEVFYAEIEADGSLYIDKRSDYIH